MEEGVGNIRLDSSSESDPSSSLLNAARKGDAKEVKRLLSDVLSPDSPLTQSGRTLLHVSAHHGHLGVLLLVASNSEKWGPANPNVINKSGHTPLHEACAQGRTEVVHFLLSQGALVNAAAKDGTTCLMLASHGGHVTTTKILISSGADVNSANLRGWTAAHFCAYKGDVQMVKLLVFHGCDVERRSNDGKWAGAIAEEEGHMECTEELKKARGLVSMATESHVVALEGRLALAEEALRNLQEESDQLISSNVEEVRTQYEDLFTSLKEQLVEKESEIAQLRNLKSKQALLPKVEPKAANSAPSSPHPHRKVYQSQTKDTSSVSQEGISPEPADQQGLAGWTITDLVELSLTNPNCMSAIRKEIKSDQLTPKISRKFQGKTPLKTLSPLASDTSPLSRTVARQPVSQQPGTKSLADSIDVNLPKLV